jgi:hypothetical protein
MNEDGCQPCGKSEPHQPCEKCGEIVHIGEWPFCPHGRSVTFYATKFEAFISKNLGGSSIMSTQEKMRAGMRGVEIRTKGQHERAMKERGFVDLRDVPLADHERK